MTENLQARCVPRFNQCFLNIISLKIGFVNKVQCIFYFIQGGGIKFAVNPDTVCRRSRFFCFGSNKKRAAYGQHNRILPFPKRPDRKSPCPRDAACGPGLYDTLRSALCERAVCGGAAFHRCRKISAVLFYFGSRLLLPPQPIIHKKAAQQKLFPRTLFPKKAKQNVYQQKNSISYIRNIFWRYIQ